MGPLDTLETALVGVSKQLPQIPKNAKKIIADIAPWITLAGGLLFLLLAWFAYEGARTASSVADWANQINAIYGTGTKIVTNNLTASLWITLLILAVEAILMFVAFPALRKFKKSGWNMLFIISIVNIAYGIVTLFTYNGGIFSLFSSIIGTAIGWYLLFQVREIYLGKKTAPAKVETKHEVKK
ncbi:MAG: hypothetical protein WCP03_04155 [Candidatus Saccharibacteria bacterium]